MKKRPFCEFAPATTHAPNNGQFACMFDSAKEHINQGKDGEAILILHKLLKVLMRRANWPKITYKDIEAFRLVHIQGLKRNEAAILMGCSKQAVSKRLKKLKNYYPHIFTPRGDCRILELPVNFFDRMSVKDFF